MHALHKAIIVAAISSAPFIGLSALEATAQSTPAKANQGLDARLVGVESALTVAYNALEARVDALEAQIASILARLGSLESRMTAAERAITALRTWAQGQFNTINTTLGQHNTRIRVLENAPAAGKLTFVRTVDYVPTSSVPSPLSTGPWVSYDLCVLSDEGAQTVDDNHGHRCKMEINPGTSANQYRLTGYARRMSVQCAMDCYNY